MSDHDRTQPLTVPDDRLRVLRMVEEQQISPDEAARLLEALDRADRQRATTAPAVDGPRSVHLRIANQRNGRKHIDITLPLPMIEVITSLIEKFVPNSTQRVRPMIALAKSGFIGPLLDFTSGDDRIEITIDRSS